MRRQHWNGSGRMLLHSGLVQRGGGGSSGGILLPKQSRPNGSSSPLLCACRLACEAAVTAVRLCISVALGQQQRQQQPQSSIIPARAAVAAAAAAAAEGVEVVVVVPHASVPVKRQ